MRYKLSTRALTAFSLAAALAAVVAACGGSSGGTTTITFWTRVNPSPDLAKEFNKTHKDIKVKATTIPDAQYVNKLGAAVRGRSAPDVVDFDDINGPVFASTGILTDVTSKVNALPFKNSLARGHMALSQYNGKFYAVPYIAGPSVMMYNRELFKKAGLDPDKPPTTWAQIEADAKKIKALGNGIYGFMIPGACGGCLLYTTWPLMWASGGQVMTDFGPDQRTTYAESAPVADALLLYRRLWQAGVVPPSARTETGATWSNSFTAGKVGILLGTPVFAPTAKKAGVDVGMAPIPGKNGGYSTFDGGDLLGIPSGSKHPDEAWTFIKWLLETKQQEGIAKGYLVPVRQDMLNASFKRKYPDVAVALTANQRGQVPRSIAFNAATEDANAPWLAAAQKVIFAGADPKATLAAADAKSRDILKTAYEQQGGK